MPDSTYWVLGTIAKSIVRFNPWMEATVASGPVIERVFTEHPELVRNFDLVHFLCPYVSKKWLPRLRDTLPCVTSHHHVTDWDYIKHNLGGDAIVVGSSEWKQDLLERGASAQSIFCVPYGVDAEQFTPADEPTRRAIRLRLGVGADETAVGFFAKMSSNDGDRKGTDVFAEALHQLRGRVPNLTPVIVGPGWQDMVGRFRASGINCIWKPYIPDYRGLADMYRSLDFYWVTARVEGGPVTLLEAMSSGVCSLTTPVGLARDIVEDGVNASLVRFNDAAGFAARTAELMQDGALRQRIANNARATILERMHIGVAMPKIREAYEYASENFYRRRGAEPPPKLNASWRSGAVHAAEAQEVPLNGFPPSLHRQIRIHEALAWSDHLWLYQKQRGAALRMVGKEWLTNPLSTQPLRFLLRRTIPHSLLSRIVRVKTGRHAAAQRPT